MNFYNVFVRCFRVVRNQFSMYGNADADGNEKEKKKNSHSRFYAITGRLKVTWLCSKCVHDLVCGRNAIVAIARICWLYGVHKIMYSYIEGHAVTR